MKSLEIKREKFFLKFAENVALTGFTIDTAQDASMQIGEDISYHLILFPGGISEIAEYYEQYSLVKLMDSLEIMAEIKGVTKKIETALIQKILKGSFSKAFLSEVSKFYLKPQNAYLAIKASWNLCDFIWNWAGDQSTDYNYYTKRGLLFSVYNAAILYSLKNDSEDTEKFIAKSLSKVASIGKAKSKIKSMIPKLENIPILRMFL
jgi:ubiquinone biosynthesis protein COQ9